MIALMKAQFSYCPVIWICHSRPLNNRNNKLSERCLRIIYNDEHLNFEKNLSKDNFVSVHLNNVCALVIEITIPIII